MALVLLTMLVCLLLSAAVAFYVAYPGRGRPLPGVRPSGNPRPRGLARRPGAGRSALRRAAAEGGN